MVLGQPSKMHKQHKHQDISLLTSIFTLNSYGFEPHDLITQIPDNKGDWFGPRVRMRLPTDRSLSLNLTMRVSSS